MGIFRRAFRGLRRLFRRKRRPAVTKRVRRTRKRVVRQTGMLTIKKTITQDRQIVNTNSNQFGVQTFELTDVPQYQSYVALYEEFKINKVVVSFKSLVNQSSDNLGGTPQLTTLGMIHSILDYNDAVAPSSIQTMMNDPSYRGTRSSRNHTRVIYPKYLDNIAGDVQGKSSRGWLNTTYVDGATVNTASHYGIKYCLEGGNQIPFNVITIPSFLVQPIITFYVSFRNPK